MEKRKPANDKLHASDLGETKDFNELSFDEENNSFEFDVKEEESDYDHPLPYDTTAPNGEDSTSTYDESNPYSGNEYDDSARADKYLADSGMRLDANGDILKVKAADKLLAQTPEDFRDDLDEEGYPKNDRPDRR
jgi:hypothetical protein